MRRLGLLFLILVIPHVASAALSIRAFSMSKNPVGEIYVKGKEGYSSLRFSSIQPSKPIQAESANPLPLYSTTPNEDGTLKYGIVKSVNLPPSTNSIILFAWPKGEKTDFFAIKDDIQSAKSDDWLLINATLQTLEMQVGEKTKSFRVPRNSTIRQSISAVKGKGATVVVYSLSTNPAKKIYSTYWPVYADKRSLVIFFPNGNKVKVKRISDQIGRKSDENE